MFYENIPSIESLTRNSQVNSCSISETFLFLSVPSLLNEKNKSAKNYRHVIK